MPLMDDEVVELLYNRGADELLSAAVKKMLKEGLKAPAILRRVDAHVKAQQREARAAVKAKG